MHSDAGGWIATKTLYTNATLLHVDDNNENRMHTFHALTIAAAAVWAMTNNVRVRDTLIALLKQDHQVVIIHTDAAWLKSGGETK